jgi:hypothetical protein
MRVFRLLCRQIEPVFFIDNYHVEVGSSSCNLFHICEFAERMEASCAVVEPAGAVIEHNQESREKDRSDAR